VHFAGELRPDNEVTPPVDLDPHAPTGGATFTFDDETKILCGRIEYGDLTGPPTGIHVHQAPKGMPNADGAATDKVIIPLPADATGAGSVSFKVKLPDAWATSLVAGEIYSNVHTAKNAKGEIRGTMDPYPEAEEDVECPPDELQIGVPMDAGAPPATDAGHGGSTSSSSSGGPGSSGSNGPSSSSSSGGTSSSSGTSGSGSSNEDQAAPAKSAGGCNTTSGPANMLSLGIVAAFAMIAARARLRRKE
jgi:hypothetical protein